MRSPYIWAPINIGDWNTATQGLTLEEKAATMTILLAYWERGEYPDEKRIPRILGIPWARWQAMQGHVGDAIASYMDRAGFKEERVRAAEMTAKRAEAANNRWAKYRQRATQGLDASAYASAYASAMTTTTTEETYTDRAQKPTMDKGLGERTVGHKAGANSWPPSAKPNGKGH
jgi:uncharacterized protein YdaU (DUF1376 family)